MITFSYVLDPTSSKHRPRIVGTDFLARLRRLRSVIAMFSPGLFFWGGRGWLLSWVLLKCSLIMNKVERGAKLRVRAPSVVSPPRDCLCGRVRKKEKDISFETKLCILPTRLHALLSLSLKKKMRNNKITNEFLVRFRILFVLKFFVCFVHLCHTFFFSLSFSVLYYYNKEFLLISCLFL